MKECNKLLKIKTKGWDDSALEPSEEINLADSLNSDFWLPEQREREKKKSVVLSHKFQGKLLWQP